MSAFRIAQLEDAVGRLLQRNAQLQAHCRQLLSEQETWQHSRHELLGEVDALLADLKQMREKQA